MNTIKCPNCGRLHDLEALMDELGGTCECGKSVSTADEQSSSLLSDSKGLLWIVLTSVVVFFGFMAFVLHRMGHL